MTCRRALCSSGHGPLPLLEAHTLTSESAIDSYTPGPVNGVQLDVAAPTGTSTFTIPGAAPPGTVLPYFCFIHLAMMGQGQLTIVGLDGGS